MISIYITPCRVVLASFSYPRIPSHRGMALRCLQTSFSPALVIDITRPRRGSDTLPRSYTARFQRICRVAPRCRHLHFRAGAGAPGCARRVWAASTSSPRAAGAPKGRSRTQLAFRVAGIVHAIAPSCSARRHTLVGGRRSAWRYYLAYQRARASVCSDPCVRCMSSRAVLLSRDAVGSGGGNARHPL